jgi:hypothetical protein
LEAPILAWLALFTRLTMFPLLARLKSALLIAITEVRTRSAPLAGYEFARLLIAASIVIAAILLRGKTTRLNLRARRR